MGFRPKRSAKQALEKVRKACNNKGYYVVDADIEKFFDNVNQDKLMVLVEQRISDRRIQKLIRQWLKSGVLYGNILTISELGTSQGSSYISVTGKYLPEHTGQIVGKVWDSPTVFL